MARIETGEPLDVDTVERCITCKSIKGGYDRESYCTHPKSPIHGSEIKRPSRTVCKLYDCNYGGGKGKW